MYSRIMVTLDGSNFAAQALPYAKLLSERLSADLVLFQAVPSLTDMVRAWNMRYEGDEVEGVYPGISLTQWEDAHARLRKDVEQDMERWAEGLRAEGLNATVRLGEGDPAEAIVTEAEGVDGTLVVMTTHGRSGISRMWMGSVADKVVHTSTTPALVVRCHEEHGAPTEPVLENIILPLDGSRLAEQAVPHAAALARALDARLEVLLAVNEPAYEPIRYAVPEAYPTGLSSRAGDYGATVLERIRELAPVEAEAITVEDDAADAIIAAGESTANSLIVMGTHGRSGFRRWLMGSVADKVVRHSGRPVLLVRPKAEVLEEAPEAVAA